MKKNKENSLDNLSAFNLLKDYCHFPEAFIQLEKMVIKSFNKSFSDTFSLTTEKDSNIPLDRVFSGYELQEITTCIQQASQGKQQSFTGLLQQTGRKPVNICFIPVHDENGVASIIMRLIFLQDEEKRFYDDFVKRHNRAEEIARFGHWELNLNTREIKTSFGARKIYGLEDKAFDSESVKRIPLEKFRPKLDKALNELIQENKPYNVEFQIKRPDNNQIRDIHSTAQFDKKRNTVLGVVRDITHEKETERKLTLNEVRTNAILANISDIVWMIDKSENVIYISPSGEKMLGFSTEDMMNKNYLKYIPDGLLDLLRDKFRTLFSKRDADNGAVIPYTMTYEQPKKNGKKISVEVKITPIYDEEGSFLYAIGVSRDITERIEKEQALQESQTILTLVTESLGIGVWDQDFVNNKVVRNDHWFKMLGYDPGDIAIEREGWLSIVHEDDKEATFQEMEEHESGRKEIFSVEQRLKTKSGDYKWIFNWGKIIDRDKDHKPVRAIGVHIDINKRKRAEQALIDSEKRYRLLVENAPDGILISVDNKIVFINESGLSMLGGKSKSEFNSLQLNEFIDQDDVEGILKFFDKTSAGQSNPPFEINLKRLDKSELPAEIHVSKVSYINKQALQIIFRNLTERNEVERARREVEARYRAIAENYPNGIIFVMNTNGIFVFAEGKGLENVTLAKKDIIGKSYSELFPAHISSLIDDYLADVKNNNYVRFEIEIGNRTYSCHAVPVKSSNNIVEQTIIISTDISDRKKAEQLEKDIQIKLENEVEVRLKELNEQASKLKASQKALTFLLEDVNEAREEIIRTNQQLEAANNDLEAFAYSVSHDLRAPLRHIDGFTQLLENKLKTNPDEAMEYFKKIHLASSRMHNLIDDLLTFSRLGRKKLKITSVDLSELVKDIISTYEPDLKERKIEWNIEELPWLRGDPELLKIAFDNLLSNALKFTSKIETTIIEISASEQENGWVEIMIRDNGVGFDMNYAHKIFGVFERLHSLHEFPGTGIGLANVKRVIQSHGGKIRAESEIDNGAAFFVTLPQITE
ncbi:MAG: PAS domain S-box protein [Bacteroidales bacterium]|nr:PAS domain S-box protein [Bacteroidales bacterium]